MYIYVCIYTKISYYNNIIVRIAFREIKTLTALTVIINSIYDDVFLRNIVSTQS